jgi:hypothetical protein
MCESRTNDVRFVFRAETGSIVVAEHRDHLGVRLPRVTFTIAREREIVPAVTHRRIHRQTRIGVRAEVRFVRTGIGSFAPGRPVQDYSLTGRGIAIASVSLCNRVVNMSEGRNVFVRPEEMHVRVVNRAAVGLLAKHTVERSECIWA